MTTQQQRKPGTTPSPIRSLPKPTTPAPTFKYKVSTAAMTATRTEIQGAPKSGPQPPRVSYTPEVELQMRYIIAACDDEVGWMCYAEMLEPDSDGADHFLITEIFVPKQEVHATTTEIDPQGLNELAFKLMDEGKDPGKLIGWYHSHVDMGVSPSGQDEEMIQKHLESNPVMIRGIMNKKGASKVDVYYREHGVAFTCVTTGVYYPFTTNPLEGLDEILAKNVVEQDIYPYNGYGYPNSLYSGATHGIDYYGNARQPKTSASSPGKPWNTGLAGKGVTDEDDDFPSLLNTASHVETGFGTRWTVNTPLHLRPDEWHEDDAYWEEGHHNDIIADNGNFFK
ncbi:MPN domain-containing protein [Kineobactrum salinum]|uniref:MPN domain-containing protein n=1 Tax=Kineobactrum salinum TaxID=2708301 RepID=A0A6C0U4Q2_9GAMM|nr:hypothetical protein [Kineobactrum salinum]QIB67130.1 hypothetical protein G3T16_18730 [Kineobactrum salinum]